MITYECFLSAIGNRLSFEYQFHLDISAAEDVTALEEAVGRLRARSRSFRILGQYPAAAWPLAVV